MGGRVNPIFATLPQFCRVTAKSHPTPDSDITVEVWMPSQGWNGRLEAVGNGDLGSDLDYGAMALAFSKGYAAAATDTGHTSSNSGAFAIGHPEKLVDWGSRAVHEMAVDSKLILAARYKRPPQYSY